jgi:hypothetical protein
MSEVGSRCIGKILKSFSIHKFYKILEDGFYPDRDDCRKFHVCYSGTQSIRWCKEGMLWDETKIGCSAQNNTSCTGNRKKWGRSEGIILLNNQKKKKNSLKFRYNISVIKIKYK